MDWCWLGWSRGAAAYSFRRRIGHPDRFWFEELEEGRFEAGEILVIRQWRKNRGLDAESQDEENMIGTTG